MRKPKGKDQYVKAVEYSHTLEKLLIMERENSAALRDELEAAERERDELKDKLNSIKSTYCHVDTAKNAFIPGCLDAWGRPVPQYLPYDFSSNPGASATQYCNGWNDSGGYWLKHVGYLQQKLSDAEEELARRDAAAGEADIVRQEAEKPIAEVAESFIYFLRKKPNGDRWPVGTKLYTAAPPAVLPPAISTDGLDPESRDIDEVRNLAHIVGANWMRQRCLELGAQPQKPVVLPAAWSFDNENALLDLDSVIAALDAANVKWVGK